MTTREPGHLSPISAHEAPGAQIYERLKAAILHMDLTPGALVSETDIGLRLGASRTPVRAALARLRDEGLIATRPSRGNYVTLLSPRAIHEAQFIRETLERGVIVRLTAIGIGTPDAAHIEANLEASERALAAQDPVAFHRLDDDFHGALARATSFPRLDRVLAREKVLLDRLRVLSLDEDAHLRMLLDEHHAIFAAVVERDADLALKRLSRHLSRVLTTLDETRARHADFFDDDRNEVAPSA